MARVIFHVDMDAFFASVEVRDNPSLRGKPVLVGGTGNRGVVAAASYEARAFGCRSAQPMAVARRKCPDAVVLPPRREAYLEASRAVFEIFRRYSPLVEGLSIDEAFLDMTGTERLVGPAAAAARSLKADVFRETDLTCSVGIAAVKFLSKIASALEKPDGLTEVAAGAELAFLDRLAIERLWGVGPRAQKTLKGHGIHTVGELREVSLPRLQEWFGKHGGQMWRLSRAQDPRDVQPGHEAKSVSHEDTFGKDIFGQQVIKAKLLGQATRVADRLVRAGLRGRKVHLKIRDGSFKTETRQCTLDLPTQDGRVIYRAVCNLLAAVDLEGRGFRLTGVGVGGFEDGRAPVQLDLLPAVPAAGSGARLQGVMSAVRERFGGQALYPADTEGARAENATGTVSHPPDSE